MSTVQEIKTAIDHLPLEQRAELVAELCGWTDDGWDRQMKADTKAGKHDAMNRDADAAHRGGMTQPISDITGQPRGSRAVARRNSGVCITPFRTR